MTTPAVSVIVAARDAEATLGACLASLRALDHPSYELIVVDNGSTDATRAIAAAHDGVRVLDEPRRGPAAARNTGIEAARGDVVAFTDADCVVDPRWLTKLTAALEDRRDRVAGGRILATRPANRVERYGERIHDHEAALTKYDPPYAITMNWAMAEAARPPPVRRGAAARLGRRPVVAPARRGLVVRLRAARRSSCTATSARCSGWRRRASPTPATAAAVRRKHGIAGRRRPRAPRSLPEAAFEAGKALGALRPRR